MKTAENREIFLKKSLHYFPGDVIIYLACCGEHNLKCSSEQIGV